MSNLLLLPILIPFITGIFLILLWEQQAVQRILSVVGAALLLVAGIVLLVVISQGGILALQIGSWGAPFGITLVADTFSAIMLLLTGIIGFSVAVYSLVSMDADRERFGYYPLFHILLMGVCGAFLTGDLFNLYVWYEVMLIASFVLIALGGEKRQLEGGFKYVTLNLIASALFLVATGIVYSVTGTLNMADLAVQIRNVSQPGVVPALAVMFLIAFGIKAAVFPLFFWLPSSYHTPPVAVTTIFSGLLTKVGVYSLVRVFTLIFVQDAEYMHNIILIIAAMTMIVGVFGAVVQTEFRRLLSFHIISQIGYLLMGLGLFSVLSLTGTVFFMMHVILAKSALFLVSGVVHRLRGTYDLKKLGGLYENNVWLAVLFLIPALSLAGIPPFSGFWAKFTLVRAGLEDGQYLVVFAALGVSVLTLFSMTKIWAEAFWKDTPSAYRSGGAAVVMPSAHWMQMIAPIVLLAVLIVVLGLAAEPVYLLATQAAEQLLNPSVYIETVLGGG